MRTPWSESFDKFHHVDNIDKFDKLDEFNAFDTVDHFDVFRATPSLLIALSCRFSCREVTAMHTSNRFGGEVV